MSLYTKCASCKKVATRVCVSEEPPHFYCNNHAMKHILSSGEHLMRASSETLSAFEVSTIQKAYNNHLISFLREATSKKNSYIERLLQEMRRLDQEYKLILKKILNSPIAKLVQEILSNQALPLFSNSSFVQSLLHLKNASDLSISKIEDLLKSLNSSLLSNFPSFSSTRTSSTQTYPPSADFVQLSSMSRSSVQPLPSQKSTIQEVDPSNYRWELLKQTRAHNDWIKSIAVSECQEYLASASRDGTIKIHQLQTLRHLRTLKGHTSFVTSVAFLGDKVVSGSDDTTIKIWEEDRCVNTLNLHSNSKYGYVNSVCVSSCKTLIVSGSSDKTAVVFRLEDNKTMHTLTHSDSVESVAFSWKDKEIVSGSIDGKIRIWKTDTGELLKTLNAHSDYVTCVCCSGKFIASSSNDKIVKIWDRDKIFKFWRLNKNQPLLAFTDHTQGVSTVDVRDNIVASLGWDHRIIVRNIRSGTVIQILQAHGTYPDYGYKMDLKILEGGKFIVSGGVDGKLKVWGRVN